MQRYLIHIQENLDSLINLFIRVFQMGTSLQLPVLMKVLKDYQMRESNGLQIWDHMKYKGLATNMLLLS